MTGVPGIVTANRSNGFYMQDPAPDADPATSEGIFVFTSSAPTVAVGDSVLVSGTVDEFRPTAQTGPNLTTTEITGGPTVALVSSANPLPAATIIGTGGRIPPATTIDDDPTADVENPAHVFDVAKNAIDFFESMEGMLVTVNAATVVDGSSTAVSNGEIPVLPAGVAAASRSPRGAALIGPYVGADTQLSNANPGRVFLDDEVLKFPTGANPAMPAANVGDTIATATGPLDYSFGNFKLEVTARPARDDRAAAARGRRGSRGRRLTVATYNVENLTSGDPQAKFDGLAAADRRQPARARHRRRSRRSRTTTAPPTTATIGGRPDVRQADRGDPAAGGPTYQYRQIDPVDGADGGEPGGNIRVGFLFRTDRGLAFVDRPGGDADHGGHRQPTSAARRSCRSARAGSTRPTRRGPRAASRSSASSPSTGGRSS